jgi:hypothetical protein
MICKGGLSSRSLDYSTIVPAPVNLLYVALWELGIGCKLPLREVPHLPADQQMFLEEKPCPCRQWVTSWYLRHPIHNHPIRDYDHLRIVFALQAPPSLLPHTQPRRRRTSKISPNPQQVVPKTLVEPHPRGALSTLGLLVTILHGRNDGAFETPFLGSWIRQSTLLLSYSTHRLRLCLNNLVLPPHLIPAYLLPPLPGRKQLLDFLWTGSRPVPHFKRSLVSQSVTLTAMMVRAHRATTFRVVRSKALVMRGARCMEGRLNIHVVFRFHLSPNSSVPRSFKIPAAARSSQGLVSHQGKGPRCPRATRTFPCAVASETQAERWLKVSAPLQRE